MKSLILALALGAVMMQEHVEPPRGWQCANHPKTAPDKLCACHRTCTVDKDTGRITEHEDPACKSFCFRDHCDCIGECET